MIDDSPGVPLGSWLADMSDAQLVQLLRARPDLTQPPPATLSALQPARSPGNPSKPQPTISTFYSWRYWMPC